LAIVTKSLGNWPVSSTRALHGPTDPINDPARRWNPSRPQEDNGAGPETAGRSAQKARQKIATTDCNIEKIESQGLSHCTVVQLGTCRNLWWQHHL